MWQEQHGAISEDNVRDFMYKVYGWMAAALSITAGVAYWVFVTPVVFNTIVTTPLLWVLFFAQIGVVFYFSSQLQKMSYHRALASFLIYSGLSGLTFSVYFYIYTMESLYQAFAITAGMFLGMSLYGYFTKADLSSMDSFLRMGVWGLVLTMFVNMWFRNPMVSYFISLTAVGVFTLLTAWDTQKIKQMAITVSDDQSRNKVALFGSLMLYLDFINIFIHLLRLFGKRRN